MANKNKAIYRIHFIAQKSVYQIYAKHVSQSNMLGFITIEDLIFGKAGGVVVDPAEEKLRNEFEGVKRIYVPNQIILRIDEVEKEGIAKIVDSEMEIPNNITVFNK